MRKTLLAAAIAASAWTAPAAAVHSEEYPIPYFGVGPQHVMTDTARDADDGLGFQLTLGMPFDEHSRAVELRFFDVGYERADGRDNFQSGLFVDYVHTLGLFGSSKDAFLAYVKPFVVAGVGFYEEDVNNDKHLHLGLSVGGGAIVPLGWNGWALRLDARAQPQVNNESVTSEDYLLDYAVNLGLQIPMSWFYDRPGAMKAAEDCPLAVVDPATGRRDCVADADGDGVVDSADECPGTHAGVRVDRSGCPQAKPAVDTDGDGVPDKDDDCAETERGLKVDEDGCVVAQKTALKGVTFEPNSATLTGQGRDTLDGVAATLKGQDDLEVEIGGHTDAMGSDDYNQRLSQQRAEAVRAYLVGKGIDAERLEAAGYGEKEPVASNDTDEGRRANRRVEFRITD